jgi:hypothetical protein
LDTTPPSPIPIPPVVGSYGGCRPLLPTRLGSRLITHGVKLSGLIVKPTYILRRGHRHLSSGGFVWVLPDTLPLLARACGPPTMDASNLFLSHA